MGPVKTMDPVKLAGELGIANTDTFSRFVLDKEVRDIVSSLIYTDFRDHSQDAKVQLLRFSGWQAARREHLIRSHNADTMLGLGRGLSDHPWYDTQNVILAAFERMERRRGAMGLDPWGSMGLNWRVCCGVVQLYIGDYPGVYDQLEAPGGWTEANRRRLDSLRSKMVAWEVMWRGRVMR